MADYKEAGSGTADVQMVTGRVTIVGYSVRESAATAATAEFVLRDGTDASAPGVLHFILAGDEAQMMFPPEDKDKVNGVVFRSGVYLDRIAGTSDVTVFTE